MQKRLFKVLVAFVLIMTMTMSNFLLVGISAVSAVEQIVQEKNTNNKNVEFMAYFKDDEGNNVSSYSSKSTDSETKLYLSVSVKQEGYFNGAISLKDSNFKFKTDVKNEKISEITENKISLNQIKAGDTVEVEINAEMLKDSEYALNLISKESTLELEGTYRDSKEKDITVKGTRKVTLKMVSPYSKENNGIFLKQTVLTNKVLNYDGDHRVVQLQIETGLKDNMYPVKDSTVELQVPTLNGKYPESVNVQTPEELSTNRAKISDKDETKLKYNYDSKTGKVEIIAQNPEKDGKVVWNKTGEDRYVVTYIFAGTEKVEEQKVTADAKINLYDKEQTKMSYNSEITLTSDDVDSVINVTVKNQEDDMYKGRLYAGLDKEFTEKIELQVNLENIAEKISVQEDYTNIGISNVYTKNITLNKSSMLELLGQDGNLKILDKNTKAVLAEINNQTEADNDQNIIISLPDKTTEVIVESTKPVKTGVLEISITKVIKQNNKKQVKNATEINYLLHTNYSIGNVENKIADSSAKIELKETQTNATLSISKTEFSTMRTNENVEVRVVLKSNSEQDELYKNPHVLVGLPEEFEKIEVTSIKLLNEEELKIKSAHLVNKIIDIQLEGEQTQYKGQAVEGATILMTMNLTTNKKQKNVDKQIVLNYTNDNAINYANGQKNGSMVTDVKIVSYAGVITTNGINEYGIEVINNEGTKNAKLELASDKKTATVRSEIMNNQETAISNVQILGTFPTKDAVNGNTLAVSVGELQISGVDTSKVKVYYSENANATADINNASNSWEQKITNSQNVKKYLIAVDSLDVSEDMNISYNMTIPENLAYNETASENYEVNYVDSTGVEQNIKVETMELTTGKGATVETNLKATVGGKEVSTAKEGEKIQYVVTAKNTGSEKVEKVTLTASVPDGTIYTEEVTPSTEMGEDVPTLDKFNEIEDKKEVKYENISLEPGQEITKKYMVKVKKGTAALKTVSNTVIVQYGEAKKESNTVTTKIEEGKLEVSVSPAEDIEVIRPGYTYRYIISVKNITDKDLKNVNVNFNVDNFTITQMLIQDGENLKIAENTDTYKIEKLEAGKEIEIYLYLATDSFTDIQEKIAKISAVGKVDNTEYSSNEESMNVIAQIINVTNESKNSGQYIKAGEQIEYKIKITNPGDEAISGVELKDKISSYESVISVKSDDKELSESDYKKYADLNDDMYVTIKDELSAGQTKNYTIVSEIDSDADNEQAVEIENTAEVYVYSQQTGKSQVMHILEPVNNSIDDDNNNGDDNKNNNNNNGNNNSNNGQNNNGNNSNNNVNNNNGQNNNGNNNSNNNDNNNQNNNSNSNENKQNLKIISGIAWLDKDGNGQRDDNEDLLQGIKVRLFNVENNQYQKNSKNEDIMATTNDKGFYSLSDVPEGKYIVVFEYDTSKYGLTSYEKDGVSEEKNSKVISKQMQIGGIQKEVAVTEEFTVKNNHISYMNIGLKELKVYDMKLEKMINRVVVQNSKTTRAVEYQDVNLAKVDLDSKQLRNTSVVVEYKIKVTNEGEVAGYIRKIQDYVSSDFKFSSELNKDWYQSGSNLYNNSLANVKIEPGESKEVTLILTKQMTENNTGLVNNTAEIVESYNEQGLKDVDSTEGNRANGEDDIGSADLILSIKTGQVVEIVLVILSTIVILGVVAYVVTKKVLSRKII